ncbi:MAG: hypothetical protein PHC61_07940 [Chitinivibrionales bacterium]|nr:hypothetical protein [Chitinivibrionales bacterium]
MFIGKKLKVLTVTVLIFFPGIRASQQTGDTAKTRAGLPDPSACTVSILSDTEVVILCPDSTILKGRVVSQDNKNAFVRNPYLGIFKLTKKNVGNSVLWTNDKYEYRPDPLTNTTIFNQTAFVGRQYPIGIQSTDIIYLTLDATVTPTTYLWFDCVPAVQVNQEYSFGIKQQLYINSKKDFAVALSGQFTHPESWGDQGSTPLYAVNGKVLVSTKFFFNGSFHAGFLYTIQKRYRRSLDYTDGTWYYYFNGFYYRDIGFMACLDYQPFRTIKLFLEYSDTYGIVPDSDYLRSYVFGMGSRFLWGRFSMDLAFAAYMRDHNYMPLPIVRLAWFFGNFKK